LRFSDRRKESVFVVNEGCMWRILQQEVKRSGELMDYS